MSKERLHEVFSCMLSILDTLKLHDTGTLYEEDETLSEMMFRKMKGYNIDLNKELGFTHLKPVKKITSEFEMESGLMSDGSVDTDSKEYKEALKIMKQRINKNKKLDDIIDKVIRDAGGLDNFNLIEEEEKYDLIRKMMRMWKDYHIVKALNRMKNRETKNK